MQSCQQQQVSSQEVPSQQSALVTGQNLQSSLPQAMQNTPSQQSGVQCYSPSNSTSNVPGTNALHHVAPHSVPVTGLVPSSIVPGPATQQQQPSVNKQVLNTASLCFLGQETVQDIVTKVLEMFQILKGLNPPLGTVISMSQSNEKRAKLLDLIKTVKDSFKKLRYIYDKCNDDTQFQGMEYMHIESLIPVKEEWDMKTSEEKKTSETYRLASEDLRELIEQVMTKNILLKEVIDHLRRIVWEINTMLLMRKS